MAVHSLTFATGWSPPRNTLRKMTLYHIDRNRTLKEGQVLELARYADVEPQEIGSHVDRLWPEGVTNFGEHHLLQHHQFRGDYLIEFIFELVRRASFHGAPSRYQSLFGVSSLEAARAFIWEFAPNDATTWGVEAERSERFDMRHLTIAGSGLMISERAHQYWGGEPSPHPLWEVLLVPPVKILHQVETQN